MSADWLGGQQVFAQVRDEDLLAGGRVVPATVMSVLLSTHLSLPLFSSMILFSSSLV